MSTGTRPGGQYSHGRGMMIDSKALLESGPVLKQGQKGNYSTPTNQNNHKGSHSQRISGVMAVWNGWQSKNKLWNKAKLKSTLIPKCKQEHTSQLSRATGHQMHGLSSFNRNTPTQRGGKGRVPTTTRPQDDSYWMATDGLPLCSLCSFALKFHDPDWKAGMNDECFSFNS